ncbi:MAG: glycosyltransferase family 39 protein [candidate division NC10 bacterium]|nr:glycosyltransferase family 39 protein [candidate division NC10 bacterium]
MHRLLSKHQPLILAGVSLFTLLATVLAFNPKPDWADDGEYIVLARSIANGQWMREINHPESPRSTKFPFGFPLLLAMVEKISQGNLLAMKSLVVAFFVAAAPLIYLLAKRYVNPWWALAMTLLSILNPFLLSFSHQVMTEVPYLFFSILSLLFAEDLAEYGRTPAIVVAVVLILATTLRSIGVSLSAGVIAFLFWRREGRKAAQVAILYVVGILLFHLMRTGIFGSFYLSLIGGLEPGTAWSPHVPLPDLMRRMLSNLQQYGLGRIPLVVLPIPSGFVGALSLLMARVVNLILVAVLLVGLGIQLFRRQATVAYFLCYLGGVFLFPADLSTSRYLVPVIPLLLLFLASGLQALSEMLARRSGRMVVSAALLACFSLIVGLYFYFDVRFQTTGETPRVLSYLKAADWARENLPPEAVILVRKPHFFYLISHQKTVGFIPSSHPDVPSSDPETIMGLIRRYKVNYMVVDNVVRGRPVGPSASLVRTIKDHPGTFELVYRVGGEISTFIFRVRVS